MSAIFGVCRRDGAAVAPGVIESLDGALAHRGHDASGARDLRRAALGQRRTEVTPESAREAQPVTSGDGRFTLVADARLDNRDELCRALDIPESLETGSDAGIALEAWKRWGWRALPRLIGDWAIAVWDDRRRELVLARDPMGVRSVFYRVTSGSCVFASEVKAIAALEPDGVRVDEAAVVRFALGERDICPRSFYAGVREVEPGAYVTVSERRVRSRKFWEFDLARRTRLRDEREYCEGYLEILSRAVRDRVRSDHPVAAMLSGGLDSSSIVCLAAREEATKGRRVAALSWALPASAAGERTDERPWIEAVKRSVALDHEYVLGRDLTLLGELDEVIRRNDGPSATTSCFLLMETYRVARERGARTVLSGFGGDEAATSIGRGAELSLLREGRFRDAARLQRDRARAYGRAIPGWPVFLRRCVLAGLPRPARRAVDCVARLRGDPKDGRASDPRLSALGRAANVPPTPWGADFGEQAVHRLRLGHLSSFAGLGARLAGPEGLEYGFPMLDRRLLEYVLSVPAEVHVGDGSGRWLARRSLRGIVPDEVLNEVRKLGAPIPDGRQRLIAERESLREVIGRGRELASLREAVDLEAAMEVLGSDDLTTSFLDGFSAVPLLRIVGSVRFLELDAERRSASRAHEGRAHVARA